MGPLGLIALLCSLSSALANTEIINFGSQESALVDLEFAQFWPILRAESSTLKWNVTAAQSDVLPQDSPHELWVALDLDDGQWKNFDKFTLRLSWPAFFPTDVSMRIYDPPSLAALAKQSQSKTTRTTRRKYARIQLSNSGVLTPSTSPSSASPDLAVVPIFLALEPLYFGVLPPSVIPTIWAIVSIIVFGIPAALKLNTVLQKIAQRARQNKPANEKVE